MTNDIVVWDFGGLYNKPPDTVGCVAIAPKTRLRSSFFIWSNAFLSCGLHFCDIATGESNNSERKHNTIVLDSLNMVAIQC
jgi:hypothetical protein